MFPQVIARIYRKVREWCHTKTQEEIEKERKIQSIITLPSTRSGKSLFIFYRASYSE